MNSDSPTQIHITDDATGYIAAPGHKGKPITVIGTNSICAGFDAESSQQAPPHPATHPRHPPPVTVFIPG